MIDKGLTLIFANQSLVFLIVGFILLGLTDLGFRRGLRLHADKNEIRRGQISGIQAAILGMLGLLLGFTFAMAVGRYDNRRALVLAEANSIGTTFLRASLLPEPQKIAIESLLREYVETRIAFHNTDGDPLKQAEVERKTSQSHRDLWAHTIEASKTPTPVTATFINALNETIDLDATRLQATRTHVPGAVWLLVLSVAAAGCFSSGFCAGVSGTRNGFSNLLLPLLITVVITLISDLDRPYKGLIGIDQQPLLDLKESIKP